LQGAARENGRPRAAEVGEAVGDAKTQADGLYNQAGRHGAADVGPGRRTRPIRSAAPFRAQPLVAAAVAVGIGYILGRLTA